MNYEAVSRTDPATPVLLMILVFNQRYQATLFQNYHAGFPTSLTRRRRRRTNLAFYWMYKYELWVNTNYVWLSIMGDMNFEWIWIIGEYELWVNFWILYELIFTYHSYSLIMPSHLWFKSLLITYIYPKFIFNHNSYSPMIQKFSYS